MQHIADVLIHSLGYPGVFLLMSLFAAELVMPLAGYLAWAGSPTLYGVIIAGTLGSCAGSLIIYSCARLIPVGAVHAFVRRRGRWFGISVANLVQAERWFDRHAKTSVFFGKLLPWVRTATSVVAGYRHMGSAIFILCTVGATAAWSAVLAYAGYVVSDNYQQVQRFGEYISDGVLVLVVACVVTYLYLKKRRASR